ncbi:putative fatty acyl-CoA reductase CG5065 isoform X2 [Centruroides sculpturatus]|uniref:putative fatty acyl-CoA reductase CG5065 isoform X2 n=1 Tax=Centruroides sculpturatus TaxID=218467 RepID=UPI000C6CFF94|nr:putative fatty acyl-CoA reductase CG5065 isoform X2 [Centruroides sculpturatus]
MVNSIQDENGFGTSLPSSITSESSYIADYYKDKSVLITGATGFVGKVLVEKLLRSCSNIKYIYLLLRTKDGMGCRQRLDQLLGSQIFAHLKRENPKSLTKVIPISGDVTLPGLGLSETDTNILTANVSVVFHCAATVKFDEPFKKSVSINVEGTRRIVELCHKMVHISALVHVSTAYCFCYRKEIEEIVYSESMTPQKIIEMAEWMDEDLLASIVPKLLNGRPSNYHYTKALAENLLTQEMSFPVAIVRPSIITAAWKEPIPGWVDNYNGPSGFIVATGKGILRTMLVDRNIGADVVPVDLVVNLMITVGWHIGVCRPNSLTVYNCTTGSINKITWGDIKKIAYPIIIKHPSMQVFRYPGGSFKTSRFWNEVCLHFQHILPAAIVDFLAWITGNKPGLLEVYKSLHRAVRLLEYFTTNEWHFDCNNVLLLMNSLSGRDRQTFGFDIRPINWSLYMENYVLGVRRYLLKEDESTLPAARTNLTRIYYYWQAAHGLLLCVIFYLSRQTMAAHSIWWFLVSLILQIQDKIRKLFAS